MMSEGQKLQYVGHRAEGHAVKASSSSQSSSASGGVVFENMPLRFGRNMLRAYRDTDLF